MVWRPHVHLPTPLLLQHEPLYLNRMWHWNGDNLGVSRYAPRVSLFLAKTEGCSHGRAEELHGGQICSVILTLALGICVCLYFGEHGAWQMFS